MSQLRHHGLNVLFKNKDGSGYDFWVKPRKTTFSIRRSSLPLRRYRMECLEFNPQVTRKVKKLNSDIQSLTFLNGYIVTVEPNWCRRLLFYLMNKTEVICIVGYRDSPLESCNIVLTGYGKENIVFSDHLSMRDQHTLLRWMFKETYHLYHWEPAH